MPTIQSARNIERVANYADMFSAMGTEPRLRIMQLLLSAHPDGLVVGEMQAELNIPNSTLSHHLDKLKTEDLVRVSRESTFVTPPTPKPWRNYCSSSMPSAAPETRR
jgi:DNA-binding transcriptional ArsR family regulator